MKQEHLIKVGIMAEQEVVFELHDTYRFNNKAYSGQGKASLTSNGICITMDNGQSVEAESIYIENLNGTFSVDGVTIGVDFHWENKEKQSYQGNMLLIQEAEKIRFINILDVEDYLESVISSEMSEMSSPELLKAHTIISRSWLLAQIQKSDATQAKKYNSWTETNEERIKWYDREDHDSFHVCADDHCQRYQGITRISSDIAKTAVAETSGQVLMYNNNICDARYYKCCGGITERFDSAWESIDYPYLQAIEDNNKKSDFALDFSNEENARQWIKGNPAAFCNVEKQAILKQVLNDFDQTTVDFYRWQVHYTQSELSQLMATRSGIDFGDILELIPLERGSSARITRLKVVGSKRTFILGKELEIRKVLSASHLYSSAFVVDYGMYQNGIPQKFTFYGAGWGHGVGLCQIGAAVMADKGYNYQEILLHYFKGASIVNL